MQLLRDRTTLAEKRGGYVHRANTCEDKSAFEPAGHTERPLDTLDYRRGRRVRTSESVSSEPFLWVVDLWLTAGHQVSRRSGGLPGERRTVARTIFAPSCPMLSSIDHQGMEHIQV
jgi:hypothetical protein